MHTRQLDAVAFRLALADHRRRFPTATVTEAGAWAAAHWREFTGKAAAAVLDHATGRPCPVADFIGLVSAEGRGASVPPAGRR